MRVFSRKCRTWEERIKRPAISAAGVELFSVLIDTGDITAEDVSEREADFETIRGWINVAARLGAGHVRIIAGDAEASSESVGLSVTGLRSLADYASAKGVVALTENFKRLAARPETCLEILEKCGDEVGLCADFGNFPADSRSEDLAAVLPKANSIHAKADYADGVMDCETYKHHVKQAVESGFDGPMSLIYQDADDVWSRIEELRDATLEVIGSEMVRYPSGMRTFIMTRLIEADTEGLHWTTRKLLHQSND